MDNEIGNEILSTLKMGARNEAPGPADRPASFWNQIDTCNAPRISTNPTGPKHAHEPKMYHFTTLDKLQCHVFDHVNFVSAL